VRGELAMTRIMARPEKVRSRLWPRRLWRCCRVAGCALSVTLIEMAASANGQVPSPLFAGPGEAPPVAASPAADPAPVAAAASPEVNCPPLSLAASVQPVHGQADGPPFMRSLGRYGPVPAPQPSVQSVHAAPWDQSPQYGSLRDEFAAPTPPPHDACANEVPFASIDFSPDPSQDCYCWDGSTELDVYGGKYCVPTQRPWLECFTPLYGPGPWPPSYTCLGPTNLVRPKFYLYGDYRLAGANNNNVNNAEGVLAHRLNLDFDFSLTATERFHAFWGPLDQGQQFSSLLFDDDGMEVEDRFDGFDQNTDAAYFEGDLGYIVGGLRGTDAPFDLPIAVGLMPLVLQNGVWLEDAFVGAAATIPARNSPWADISNVDSTFFVGFDELTTRAFGADADEATFVGATTFIERRGGYLELGWAYADDPADIGRSYHNVGLSYTRRYLNLLSNSARVIVNTGQDGPQQNRTADGYLLLLENSLLTPLPYNVVPYVNLFAGFDRPQPLGRLQGPLKNTGINFESDLLTGYPILDDSGNNTYGGALGVDLLGRQFDRQLILETAVLQAFDDPAGRIAAGDQYAAGIRYQRRLNHALILRADAMHGWLENSNDIDGVRVELRHKF
jgi:hypothetical protein